MHSYAALERPARSFIPDEKLVSDQNRYEKNKNCSDEGNHHADIPQQKQMIICLNDL